MLTPFWNTHCVPSQGVNESGSTPKRVNSTFDVFYYPTDNHAYHNQRGDQHGEPDRLQPHAQCGYRADSYHKRRDAPDPCFHFRILLRLTCSMLTVPCVKRLYLVIGWACIVRISSLQPGGEPV